MMKNRLLLLFIYSGIISGAGLKSQCMLAPVDLERLCDASEYVIEGKLTFSKTFVNSFNNNVYTIYTLQAASVYKGLPPDTVYIISLGGSHGLQVTKASPSDELRNGYGFFFLKRSRYLQADIPLERQFELSAAGQGRIWYENGRLSDAFGRYEDPEGFKSMLVLHTGLPVRLNEFSTGSKPGAKRATPTITSFTPTTRTAGTDSIITISGTNFNSPQGSGFVAFRNADAGGASFISPLQSDYISWSNTQIVVKVPTGAGTGTIGVANSDPASVLSSTSLTVPYNLINATFNNVHFPTRLQGLNTGAKMVFTFNTRFYDSTEAKEDFITSMDNWRCKSFINWDTAASVTSASTAANNGTHLVTWDFNDTLSLGVLGVAISNFSGCISGGDTFFYVSDLDVLFNDLPYTGYTWEYGAGVPGTSQFDFESVATHELGHGHQLGHVIDASKVMHYSIGPNERKATISTQDSFGAKNVMAKNVVSVCGQTAMTPLNSTNCSLVALPVDWVDLEGRNLSRHILLIWKVYHEYGVEHYRVARSEDGISFSEIGRVPSSGENGSSQVLTYEFTDRDPQALNDGAYYRIHSIDYDGSEQVSATIYVDEAGRMYFYVSREGHDIIISSSLEAGRHDMHILNSIGQELPYTVNGNKIRLHGAVEGVYYIVYYAAGKTFTQKIVVFE